MLNISLNDIKAVDSQNMFDILRSFPEQVKEAVSIGEKSTGFTNKNLSKKVAVLGMGGSAIGGDLLASYLNNLTGADDIIFHTIRNYDLPGYINTDTNIIGSSYSGGTEETISAFEQSLKRCKNICCITTGGKLGEIAENNSVPVIKIPSGYQPRCALGYSFFPMLFIIMKSGLLNPEIISVIKSKIEKTIILLENKSKVYSTIDEDNPALGIAGKLFGSIPVVYSGVNGMETVNNRWVRQIQENAKHLVYGGLLPEMNHNEINSFGYPESMAKNISLILIQDKADNQKTLIRFDALESIIGGQVKQVIKLQSEADSLLTRLFDMIYLGDWVSYYLAILNKVDPTPIPLITKLKDILSSSE
jgi:glucose/mannose-6-phosphate isomerase